MGWLAEDEKLDWTTDEVDQVDGMGLGLTGACLHRTHIVIDFGGITWLVSPFARGWRVGFCW